MAELIGRFPMQMKWKAIKLMFQLPQHAIKCVKSEGKCVPFCT